MANTSNFREAIRKSQGQVIISPNVILATPANPIKVMPPKKANK